MKKAFFAKSFLIKALSVLLIIGLYACGNNVNDEISDTDRDETQDTSQSDNDGDTVDTSQSGKDTYYLNSPALDIRFFGERELKDGIYYTCNYPGSGFESKLDCTNGLIAVELITDKECSFLVYLDGELQKNAEGGELFTVKGEDAIRITNVSEGEHTLRVIRASGIGARVRLYALNFTGELLSVDGANDERMFIEFIGDGINSTVGGASLSENVGLTYPYLVAEQLNADYSITAYEGYGFISTNTSLAELYGDESYGNFSRRADVVVINVGATDFLEIGDAAIGVAKFQSEYEKLARTVRAINGARCKILLVCTSGNESFSEAVEAVCEKLGGETGGYFVRTIDNSSNIPHTEAEHQTYAAAVAEAINEIKNTNVMGLTVKEKGNGNSVHFESDEWLDI